MITVVDVTQEYLEYVICRLRKDDEQEMICEFGENYFDSLMKEYLTPEVKIMLDKDGFPIGLFGIREISTGVGIAEVCLLVTDDFKFYLKDFLVQGKVQIKKWRKKYYRIENFVYKHNTKALKWLKFFGFSLEDYDEKRMYFSLQGLKK